ncbi:EAL domain-containing protein [Paraburkholderia sp. 1N]|uniref:EAL domain-containing protein n=1 Tax=Paraburkholderia solitsugae TaxID=2675748 RepID=A0ABX2BWD9_9BURK|nr:EAL domain-containing protein [Paraburkholderia solitsugae]NPT44245.1 EAL domain-containing protein [Paraburkholderia solitsugae]
MLNRSPIGLDFLRRHQFELVLFLAVFVLIGLAGYGLARDRIKMVETGHKDALNIAEAVQLHISGELVRATNSVLGVRSDLQGNPGASTRLVQASLSEAMRYDTVSALVGADHGGEVLMVDRAGFFINQPAMASALKAAFRTLQANTVQPLPLIHDDERGIWYLPLALRSVESSRDADVFFSLVPAEQLVEAAASLQLVTDGRFGLFTGDGKRLFRYLSRERAFEIRPAPVPPNLLRILAAQQSGTFESESSVDRRYDILGYSHSDSLPLFVVVGVPKRSIEIAWLRQSAVQLFLLLAGTIASIVFGLRLKKAVLDLQGSHSQYRQLFRSVGDGLVILNRDGVIQKCNQAASRLLRVGSEQDLAGVNLFHLTVTDRDSAVVESRGLRQLRKLQPGETRTHDWQFRRVGQSGMVYVKLHLFASPRDTDPFVTALLRDVTAEREHLARQEFLARHDALTGLLNRSAFLDHVASRIGGHSDTSFFVAFVDLNRFKDINDSLGHHAGDTVLEILGGRLSRVLENRSGCIGRLGGDEIAVCADPREWAGGVAEFCQELHAAVQKTFTLNDANFEISASVGIAVYPDDATDAEQLLRCADIAMYSAKRAMIPFEYYSQKLDCYAPRSLTFKSDFARAIRNGDLALAYQPKVRLSDGALVGFEALARWTHPSQGAISPGIFIPLAETTELIYPFTDRVIRMAMRQLKSWSLLDPRVSVSVNVSMNNLLHRDFVAQVRALLAEFDVSPEQLELEVTESALMSDPDTALMQLCQIRDIGVRLSIDDFGAGHSSLAYLKKLPVHILKIDRSFIASLMTEEADRRIVESSITLAHSFNLEVVAEGVETSDVADLLTNMGCDIAQGYFYGRPAGAEAMTAQWLLSDATHY